MLVQEQSKDERGAAVLCANDDSPCKGHADGRYRHPPRGRLQTMLELARRVDRRNSPEKSIGSPGLIKLRTNSRIEHQLSSFRSGEAVTFPTINAPKPSLLAPLLRWNIYLIL